MLRDRSRACPAPGGDAPERLRLPLAAAARPRRGTSRALLGEHELAPGKVRAGTRQQECDLSREHDFAVHVLMQAGSRPPRTAAAVASGVSARPHGSA